MSVGKNLGSRFGSAAAGSVMTVSLDLDRIHFFDPDGELAIR